MVAVRKHRLQAFLYRWRWRAIAFISGGASAFALMGAGALVVVEFGLFDTTATKPHYALVSWGSHATFTHSTRLRARQVSSPPSPFTPAQVQAGAQEYVSDCMMCHGGPGVARARWVRGLTPTPPFLLDAAQRWTRPELFWIVQRGVKMSAMPAWGETRTDAQLWDVVAFLEALPNLSAADFHRMQPAATASGVAEGLSPTGGAPHFVSPR
jgi:mono/diheme cytochrome c family protein